MQSTFNIEWKHFSLRFSQINPIGKIIYYALRIEFQMRGSPHLHALIWTSDCPKLTSDNKEVYVQFIDNHVQAYLPNEETEPELHELVKTYQKHNHSKTCRKYKNISCRFDFGQFFTNRTIIAEPLNKDLDEAMKINILERRTQILTSVKQKIDEVLNPSKPDYNETLNAADILKSVGITEDEQGRIKGGALCASARGPALSGAPQIFWASRLFMAPCLVNVGQQNKQSPHMHLVRLLAHGNTQNLISLRMGLFILKKI